jgi:hypothetical protein
MINAEAWKTMDEQAAVALTGVLSSIATAGNIESVSTAFEAGLASSQHDLVSVDRLNAILRLVDGDLDLNTRARAEIAVRRWMGGVSQTVLDDTLYKIADSTDVRPESCRMLVLAGANPYKVTTNGEYCALTQVFRRQEEYVLKMVQGIIGLEPITDPSRLPRSIKYSNNDKKIESWNLLEYASILGHFKTAHWLASQIDRASPAGKLLLELGGGALSRLFLDKNGEPQRHIPTMSINNVYLPDGLGMLIGGAEFKNPDLWKKVAMRPMTGTGKTPEPYLFEIARDPRCVGWNGVPQYVALLVDTLLRHEALDVNSLGRDGSSLLMHACQRADVNLITVLLEHGADPSQRMETKIPHLKNTNAISLAKRFCTPEVVQLLEAARARRAISGVLTKAKEAVPGGVQ